LHLETDGVSRYLRTIGEKTIKDPCMGAACATDEAIGCHCKGAQMNRVGEVIDVWLLGVRDDQPQLTHGWGEQRAVVQPQLGVLVREWLVKDHNDGNEEGVGESGET
jgi:hypothetical protein